MTMMKNNELCRVFAKWEPNCVTIGEPEPLLVELAGSMTEVKDSGAFDQRPAAGDTLGLVAGLA